MVLRGRATRRRASPGKLCPHGLAAGAGLAILCLTFLRPPAWAGPRGAPAEGATKGGVDSPLPTILEKTRQYCDRLERVSLYFVNHEVIRERVFDPPYRLFAMGGLPRSQLTSLEYDYQLVRKDHDIEETRILVKEDGQPRNEPNAALKTRLYKHRNIVFGPVGMFGEYWQPRHLYSYAGEKTEDGERAFVVEARPAGAPESGMLLYGKAWIRARDFAILKIEWDQHTLGNYEVAERMAVSIGYGAEPRISIVGHYGVEKNGVRFPDRLTVREEYDSRIGIFRASETEVTYKNYKFFVVETEVRYKK